MDKTLPFKAKTIPMEYPKAVKTSEQKAALRALYSAYLHRRQAAYEALFITLERVNEEYKEAVLAATAEESEAGASTTEEAAA